MTFLGLDYADTEEFLTEITEDDISAELEMVRELEGD